MNFYTFGGTLTTLRCETDNFGRILCDLKQKYLLVKAQFIIHHTVYYMTYNIADITNLLFIKYVFLNSKNFTSKVHVHPFQREHFPTNENRLLYNLMIKMYIGAHTLTALSKMQHLRLITRKQLYDYFLEYIFIYIHMCLQ